MESTWPMPTRCDICDGLADLSTMRRPEVPSDVSSILLCDACASDVEDRHRSVWSEDLNVRMGRLK